MRPPAFVATEGNLDSLESGGWNCPGCGEAGTLNGHGKVRGAGEGVAGKDAVRGRRFFCSNRGRRPGCGRTCRVLLGSVLSGASVRTGPWWRFIAARLEGGSVAAAWEQARSGFSLESAYRWWRRWRTSESAIRTALWRGREPPGGLAAEIVQAHGAADPLAAFQLQAQCSWPGFAS